MAHIEELKNEKPEEPVIFLKPDTAMVKNNAPVYHPEFTQDMHHELELVLRIGKEGKYILQDYALEYVESIGLGIDFTARDLQSKLKAKGLPWEISKAFNQSAPVSAFIPIKEVGPLDNINFQLDVNGQTRQRGNSSLMLFSFSEIISYVSQFFMLKVGDLIFTGTPEGVAKVEPGDHLEAFLENRKLMDFHIR